MPRSNLASPRLLIPPFLILALAGPVLAQVTNGMGFNPGKCSTAVGRGTISGTVTAVDTQLAVSSSLRLSPRPGTGGRSVFSFTNVDGSFVLEADAPASYVLTVNPTDQQYAAQAYNGFTSEETATEIDLVPGQTVSPIDVTVQRARTISGRVTAEGSGVPLAGVPVTASSVSGISDFGMTNTDEQGLYAMRAVATLLYRMTFNENPGPSSKAYLRQNYAGNTNRDFDSVSVGPGEDLTGIDEELSLGGHIEGQVTGPMLGGLEGRSVSLNSPDYFASATTDESGNYSAVVASGSYLVSVNGTDVLAGKHYDDKPFIDLADPVVVTEPATISGIDMQLEPGGTISGRVTDSETGDAVANAFVLIRREVPGSVSIVTTTVTNELGEYTTPALPSGQYKVSFNGPAPSPDGPGGYLDAVYSDQVTIENGDFVEVIAPNATTEINQALVSCESYVPTTTTTVTSTTTTTGTSTTTTLPAEVCGDPVDPPATVIPGLITASDALFALRGAVNLVFCRLCVCDVNNSQSLTATDALILLKVAVGLPTILDCPACD